MELLSTAPPRRSVRVRAVALGAGLALAAAACGRADGNDETGGSSAGTGADQAAAADDVVVPGRDDDQGDETGPAVPEALFDGSVTVVVPNSAGTISTRGSQRVMAALVGAGPNAYLGGPDLPVTVRYSFVDDDIGGDVGGRWLTTNASELGLYVAPYEFERAGLWELIVLVGESEVGSALIEVVEESVVPNVGDVAPAPISPTGTTPEEIAAISTDPQPDPDFYDLSLDEALTNGRPTVVAFATPAFCRSALCGPTLETVKTAALGRDDLDVVHIEPFDIEAAFGGVLDPVPPMEEWGLVTEPWVFVVDGDGVITASFEGIVGRDELEAALAQL